MTLDGPVLPAWLIAATGVAVLAAWLVLRARDRRRARALEQALGRMAEGQPVEHIPGPADGAFGRLGRAVERLGHVTAGRIAALERERDERERILSHLQDGVALLRIDRRGPRVVRMNDQFGRLVGREGAAPPGTSLVEFARVAELHQLVRSVGPGPSTMETDLRMWHPARVLHASATRLGEYGLVLLVLRDLSEAERVDRMRQDFVANVSHELRTPLTSVRGYAETLLEGALDDPAHRETFVRIIRDRAVQMESLAQDLLSLAELERPGRELRGDAVDLRAIAEHVLPALAPRAAAGGLALVLRPGDRAPAHGDRTLIEQAIGNLIDNAVKYTEHGTVTVSAGTADGRSWIEVGDTGIGIPEQDLPRIFERFYRVDKARARARGGTGLGLSIVKHIAALHGGEVTVTSRLGEGSRFRLELPAGPIPTTAPPTPDRRTK